MCLGHLLAARAASSGELAFVRHNLNPESTFSACAAVDVNRDGRLDVVCGGWWYEAPEWKRHFVRDVEFIRGRYDGYCELPLDVNCDGWTDLVSANYRSRKLAWIEHPGKDLGPWTEHVFARPGPMETGRLVDVNGDGKLDVLPNGVRFAAWWELVQEKSPSRAIEPRWIRHDLPTQVAGHGVGFGDINGDGRGDVVGPRGWLEAPPDRRNGTWVWHPDFELHRDSSIPILVLDVDLDGDNDLVWGRGHRFGIYWMEQLQADQGQPAREPGKAGLPKKPGFFGKTAFLELDNTREKRARATSMDVRWVRHAIDTSWSQPHSLLLADLDNDGQTELIAGKRYMGHDGRDPGEYDPMMICWYRYDRERTSWRRGVISSGGPAGFGLDPKVVDLDGDGDLDLICPGRSGLFWFENLLIAHNRPTGTAANAPPHPHSYPDHSRLLFYKDSTGGEHAVSNPHDWANRRADILRGAEQAMGQLPGPDRRVALNVRLIEAVETEHYVRTKLSFAVEAGDRVPAYLLIPKGLEGKNPAMLCLHQTTRIGKGEPAGLGGRPTLDYAHELAMRGYVSIVPDYPSFGDYQYEFKDRGVHQRYASGSMKAIWNNIRAVDLLESLPEVDPDRIGCIGHSLGGHNAIFTAVFDQRIRAVVSSCGFTAFHDYYGGKLRGWTSDRYMPRIRDSYANDPNQVPFDFHELVAALAPRALFVNAPIRDSNFDIGGVRKVIQSATEVYGLLGAKDALVVHYPDSGHDFPDKVRQAAYDRLDQWLK